MRRGANIDQDAFVILEKKAWESEDEVLSVSMSVKASLLI